MPDRQVIEDLVADADEVDAILTKLDDSQWSLPTPAPEWTVAHQVAHLTATFGLAALAASDAAGFKRLASQLSDDFDANVAGAMAPYLQHPRQALLEQWRSQRTATVGALASLPPDQLVPWLVRPLPAKVLAAAGVMELFAHGQDIADALGVTRQPTDRIWHLVEFAARTWDFGYLARGLTAPDVEFGYELTAPSGAIWRLGRADSEERVIGPALDFCLLVTRRRHRADLSLRATGVETERWLDIAQAYRGSPGAGRSPGQFADAPR